VLEVQVVMPKRINGHSLSTIIIFIIMAFFSLFSALPFIWMVMTSLRETYTLFILQTEFIPRSASLANYLRVFAESPFLKWLFNSTLVALTATFSNLLICSLAGYAFARLRFWGKDVLFILVIGTLMIPRLTTLIPLFLMLSKVGLVDTYGGLILPTAVDAFGIFLMRQFMLDLPIELEDAARIDGCSSFQIFWRIIIPLCKPALASLAIFIFMWNWNDFIWPLIITTSTEMRTVTVGISIFEGRYLSNWGLVMAAATLAFIPMLIVFLALQRYFIQGISMTGIKG
jgi:multiple sugar transport system permease protein